jgi:hypothetical protein
MIPIWIINRGPAIPSTQAGKLIESTEIESLPMPLMFIEFNEWRTTGWGRRSEERRRPWGVYFQEAARTFRKIGASSSLDGALEIARRYRSAQDRVAAEAGLGRQP